MLNINKHLVMKKNQKYESQNINTLYYTKGTGGRRGGEIEEALRKITNIQ